MSENRTLARPYAKAVFQQALSESSFAKWSECLSLATLIAKDKQVESMLKDPKFTPSQRAALFTQVGKDLFFDEMVNLLQTLSHFGRLNVLPELFELYEEMRAEAERVVHVKLRTAFELTSAYKERFIKALNRKINRQIELVCQTDPSILGGAIVKAGDLVIDGSVRGKLATLSDALGTS